MDSDDESPPDLHGRKGEIKGPGREMKPFRKGPGAAKFLLRIPEQAAKLGLNAAEPEGHVQMLRKRKGADLALVVRVEMLGLRVEPGKESEVIQDSHVEGTQSSIWET